MKWSRTAGTPVIGTLWRAVFSLVMAVAGLAVVTPSAVVAATITTASRVSQGYAHACAVEANGDGWCWGSGGTGELGNNLWQHSNVAVQVSGGITWTSIQAGTWATCGIDDNQDAYCWGDDNGWMNGDGDIFQNSTDVPELVVGGHDWVSISVGNGLVCGIDVGDDAYCWGVNSAGQVGIGSQVSPQPTPQLVAGGHNWSSIAAGGDAACAIEGTDMYCWGTGWTGQLGVGDWADYDEPTLVAGGLSWRSVSLADGVTCGVTTGNAGYCWGNDFGTGALGTGTGSANSPTIVTGSHSWSTIEPGNGVTCGMETDGDAYCWGANTLGALGDGTWSNSGSPVAVIGGYEFGLVTAGGGGGCGLTTLGLIHCWGWNAYGNLGDGANTNQNSPVGVIGFAVQSNTTTVSVTVEPSFVFTVAGQTSACNGESNFATGAGAATAIALGHLAAGGNLSGGQALTVQSNAAHGFAVYLRGTSAANNLSSGGHSWTDVTGTYASPAALGAGERFGYTYADATASSSVTNTASAMFIALDNTDRAVMGSGSSPVGSGCVSFDAQAAGNTPAGSYSATVIYTAVPAY